MTGRLSRDSVGGLPAAAGEDLNWPRCCGLGAGEDSLLELLNACTPPLSRPPLSRGDFETLTAGVLGAGLEGAATAGFAAGPAASTCAGGAAAGGAAAGGAAAGGAAAGAASVVGGAAAGGGCGCGCGSGGAAAAAAGGCGGCGGGGGGGGGWLAGVSPVRLPWGDDWPRLSEGASCGSAPSSSARDPSSVAVPRSDAGGADWPSRCCCPSPVPPGANGCPAPSRGPWPASTAASIRSDSWRST
jgi:hypothetical protein